jgi:hypothetical protein
MALMALGRAWAVEKCAAQVSLEPFANRLANGLAGGRRFSDLSIGAIGAAQAVNGFEKHQVARLTLSALEFVRFAL